MTSSVKKVVSGGQPETSVEALTSMSKGRGPFTCLLKDTVAVGMDDQ